MDGLPKALPYRLTAGLVVPFELISGLPPRDAASLPQEFRHRNAAVRRLLRLVGVEKLDMRAPVAVRRRAFGIAAARDYTDFTVLMEAFAKSEDANSFYALVDAARTLSTRFPSPDWLRAEADRVSREFSDAIRTTQTVMRRTNAEFPNARSLSKKAKRQLNRGLLPYMQGEGDLRRYTFLATAAAVGAWEGKYPDANLFDWAISEEHQLRALYDGSIDVYIEAYTRYVVKTWMSGSSAERNDSFDLDQFVYMRPGDDTQILVTGDNGLLQIATETVPGRAMHLDDFRQVLRRL